MSVLHMNGSMVILAPRNMQHRVGLKKKKLADKHLKCYEIMTFGLLLTMSNSGSSVKAPELLGWVFRKRSFSDLQNISDIIHIA